MISKEKMGRDPSTGGGGKSRLWPIIITVGLTVVVMVNALDANEEIRFVLGAPWKGLLAADSAQSTAAGLKAAAGFDFARQLYWANNPNTADNVPTQIGGHALFHKVTNAAGDLS